MKWDFAIGNPPYQESGTTNNKAEAVYPHFYEGAEDIAERYLLISPARFLFNAGLTPKVWNEKMLSDKHIKLEKYYNNSADIFPNTSINGGVAIIETKKPEKSRQKAAGCRNTQEVIYTQPLFITPFYLLKGYRSDRLDINIPVIPKAARRDGFTR